MAVKKKTGKDDSSEKKRPAEEGASARPPPPKGNFSTRLVSRLTCLNTANQNHVNESRRFQFKYFVQWLRVFLT